MRRTATKRSIAAHLALLWLLACVASLPAQDVATSNSWSMPSPPSTTPAIGPSNAATAASADVVPTSQMGNSPDASTLRSARESRVPLTAPAHEEGRRTAAGRRTDSTQSLVAVAGSLAAVLGVFFVLAWLMRRTTPQGLGALPDEAFEVLGRAPLANRQQVQLLRCGRKLLLVSVTPAGAETLTEITDAAEVDRLAAACRESRSLGATAVFHRVLEQWNTRRVSHEPLSGGDLSDGQLDRSLAAGGSDERAWGDHV